MEFAHPPSPGRNGRAPAAPASRNGTDHAHGSNGTNGSAAPLRRALRAPTGSPTGAKPGAALPIAPAPAATPSKSSQTPLCARCAALCCRYVALPLDNPETALEYDNIRWYLMHENIHVFVDDGQWYIGFASRCKHLMLDNRCAIYETRPRICRKYTTDNCEWHGAEYEYEHLFTSAEQLRKFAEQELGRPLVFRPRKLKKPLLKRTRDGRRSVRLPVA